MNTHGRDFRFWAAIPFARLAFFGRVVPREKAPFAATFMTGAVLSMGFAFTSFAAPLYKVSWQISSADLVPAAPVLGFPCLIRIGATSPELFANNADGSKLSVTDAAGKPLPYEIESWNAAAKQGLVWVLVDTVLAAAAQKDLLFGVDGGTTPSGASVFLPANGWGGVYHMEGKGLDATGQAPAAQDSGSTQATGAIGDARGFENSNSYATRGQYMNLGAPASLDISGTITMEAWVRWRSKKDHRIIVCHGSAGGSNTTETVLRVGEYQDYRTGIWNGKVHHAHAVAAAGDSAQWVHLAGTHDGQRWTLYRNGVKVADTVDAVGAAKSPGSWRIGAQYTGTAVSRYFQGDIDEVRISKVARSADYFKVGYATQAMGKATFTWTAPTGIIRSNGRGGLEGARSDRVRFGYVRMSHRGFLNGGPNYASGDRANLRTPNQASGAILFILPNGNGYGNEGNLSATLDGRVLPSMRALSGQDHPNRAQKNDQVQR